MSEPLAFFLGRASYFFGECHRRACAGLNPLETAPLFDVSTRTVAVLVAVATVGHEGIEIISLHAQVPSSTTARVLSTLSRANYVVMDVRPSLPLRVHLTGASVRVIERYCALYEEAARELARTWGIRLPLVKQVFARLLLDQPRKLSMSAVRRNARAARRKGARGFDVREGETIKRGEDRFTQAPKKEVIDTPAVIHGRRVRASKRKKVATP